MDFQELKGKFLIKGKRLNKLEATFATKAAAADDTDVTEEEESNDEEEKEEAKESSKVGATSKKTTWMNALRDMSFFTQL